jgi:hypothetical protein
MKNLKSMAVLALFIFSCANLVAQGLSTANQDCSDCISSCLCRKYLGRHITLAQNNNLIKECWTDFFGENLELSFPIAKGINSVAIKFDGLGCVYPETNDALLLIKKPFLNSGINYKEFKANSFYALFAKNLYGDTSFAIRNFILQSGFSQSDFRIADNRNKNPLAFFQFIRLWNNKFLKLKVEEINKLISPRIKKIYIFISGYNVPFSLSHLQGNQIALSILEQDPSTLPEEILFMRILWPSGDFKNSHFDESNCNYDNFENLKTAIAFTYFSNRAYLAANGLREILNKINSNIPINIITHSHGSTVATTALINTERKMQKGIISDSMKNFMKSIPLPDKDINVFLNAPSIPGASTFGDIEMNSVQSKYRFFIGFNENDIVLKKQKFKIGKIKINAIQPTGYLSSTTLGCNKNHELIKTQAILRQKGMSGIFMAGITSYQKQHDFFCYMEQREFSTNFSLFLQGHFR